MTNENEEKVATRGQRRKIRAMLDGDLISFELAQAIIERDIRIMSLDEKRIAFWEERFPGKSADIQILLYSFNSWKLEIKSALPDLDERARKAIFWREITGVRKIRLSEVAAIDDALRDSFESTLEDSLSATFEDSLRRSLMISCAPTFRATLENPLRIWLEHSLELSFGGTLLTSFWVSLWTSLKRQSGALFRASFASSLHASLRASLCFSYGFTAAGKTEEAAKFKPLLDLWLTGNFPIRFDKDGRLLVLVSG